MVDEVAKKYCLYCCREKNRPSGCEFCGPEAAGQEVETHPVFLTPGTTLENKYLIGRVLGHGGFGITYLGLDLNLQMRVAIKEYMPRDFATRNPGDSTIIPYSGQATENFIYGMNKFIEEGRILARFADHPNIVSVMNFFEANDTAYLVMPYLEGSNLLDFIKSKGGRLPEAEAVQIITMVLDGLRAVHDAKLLHRDVKPTNIFLTRDGKIQLVDFGSARRALGEHSATLSKIVSDGYSPFEQYTQNAKEGSWTDIYAVSATLFHLLSGKKPPPAGERIGGKKFEPSKILFDNGISESISDAVEKGISLRPPDRFQTVQEMVGALSCVKNSNLDYTSRAFPNLPDQQIPYGGIVDGELVTGESPNEKSGEKQGISGGDAGFAAGGGSIPGFDKYACADPESKAEGKISYTPSNITIRQRIMVNDVDKYSMNRLPRVVLEKHKIIPLAGNENWMKLAMVDPDDAAALDDVKLLTGVSKIDIVPASEHSILSVLNIFQDKNPQYATCPKCNKKYNKTIGVCPFCAGAPNSDNALGTGLEENRKPKAEQPLPRGNSWIELLIIGFIIAFIRHSCN